ncbi:hypothetical protein PLESHI_08649 [Plesiomonas shigelloides 302-73]|uniref:Uncharacterized protein n=1 Tax=Plesiomonas shigelloides 302-73 TaxID=1315976 RepID=R8AR65_PLESH|nr:hypothetical protein PLESHI_08649 [Plesiomonas shigelloides 302-73]
MTTCHNESVFFNCGFWVAQVLDATDVSSYPLNFLGTNDSQKLGEQENTSLQIRNRKTRKDTGENTGAGYVQSCSGPIIAAGAAHECE